MSYDDKELYLEVLRESQISPFSNFVSKGHTPDKVDIARPRSNIDREVYRLVRQTNRDRSSRLIPILGSVGTGKTHAYHSFKDKEIKNRNQTLENNNLYSLDDGSLNWSIIYIPSPPGSIRVLMHIYTCFIEELGIDILDEISSTLVQKWAKKKKPKLKELDEIISKGCNEYPGVFTDCIKGLCTYAIDKKRKNLARRWLIGDILSEEELNKLGINSLIEQDHVCLSMIKIITENLDRVFILYFDELESPYRMFGENAERKFLEIIKRLYNEVKMLVIIIAVLKEIWPRIIEIADAPLRSRMEPEQELKPFSLGDLKTFYSQTMETFWDEMNLNTPSYQLFPLNEKLIELIFNKSLGNPRASIKICHRFIEKIVMEKMTFEELEQIGGEIVPYSQKMIEKNIDEILAEEEYQIEVNSSSVAGGALKAINYVGKYLNPQFEPIIAYDFTIGKHKFSIAGLIEHEGKKWGLDVPNVDSFSKPGNVASYYAVNRLRDAKNNEIIDKAILIVPENTSGEKFETVKNSLGDSLLIIELNENTATNMVEQALHEPTKEGLEIAHKIFGEIKIEEESIYKHPEIMKETKIAVPRLFISYSWDSEEHKKWVLHLAEQLTKDGIDVKLDLWDLKPWDDIPFWMENHIEMADFILLICTPKYGEKANKREKGVGYEYRIINIGLFYALDGDEQKKIICALRSGKPKDAIPKYLRGRFFLNFSENLNYSNEYENLIRAIFEKPKYERPEIGSPPNFNNN